MFSLMFLFKVAVTAVLGLVVLEAINETVPYYKVLDTVITIVACVLVAVLIISVFAIIWVI